MVLLKIIFDLLRDSCSIIASQIRSSQQQSYRLTNDQCLRGLSGALVHDACSEAPRESWEGWLGFHDHILVLGASGYTASGSFGGFFK